MSIELSETGGARAARSASSLHGAWALRLARLRRRRRMLASQAFAILSLQKGARALAPAAWSSLAAAVWLFTQSSPPGWWAPSSLALFACLCVAALIDARYFILPDGPLALLAAVGVAMRLSASGPTLEFVSCLSASAFAFASFRLIGWSFEKARGYPGLGQGDARLFAIAGLWLGWAGLPTCLIVATFSAALAAAIARRDGLFHHAEDPMPFGPHLALGIWLCWSFGPLFA
jgi:leader peptidase (prepilin peptidase) / N-methyltransferase